MIINPIVLTVAVLLAGDDPPIAVKAPSRDTPVGFAREISDILDAKCVACHNAALKEGKLSLETVDAMLKGGKRGPAIRAGKASESLLFTMARRETKPFMPPVEKKDHPPLTPEELGLLQAWIDTGARDDTSSAPAPTITLGALPVGVHPVAALDFSPDGKRIALGRGSDVLVHDVATGQELFRLVAHRDIIQSVRFAPGGNRLAAGSYEYATLWDLDHPAVEPRKFGPHAFRVLAIDFTVDGKIMATGGGDPSRTGEVKLWDVETARLIRSLDSLHTDSVFSVRFSPDGTKLATASADKFMKVTNVADGKDLRTFEGHTHHVLGVDWSRDGKQIVTCGADNVVKTWEFESGEALKTCTPAAKQVTAVRWVPDQPRVAGASGDGSVKFWNTTSGSPQQTFTGASDYLFALAVAPDGKLVAAGGADGVVYLWNAGDARLIRKLEPAKPR